MPPDGGTGLAGIAPATLIFGSTWLLRPLLGVRRADIRTHLRVLGQDWIEDPSNVNRRFERIRVRLDGAEADGGEGADRGDADGKQAAEARRREAAQGAAFLAREVRVVGVHQHLHGVGALVVEVEHPVDVGERALADLLVEPPLPVEHHAHLELGLGWRGGL